MTDRYDQLGPIARALVDDYDALDLAEMLVKAQDELAALRQVARGYCPACGRGDAAPTVEDWEQQKQRADQAEAEVRRLRADIAGCRDQQWPQRLGYAEAALTRARALADRWDHALTVDKPYARTLRAEISIAPFRAAPTAEDKTINQTTHIYLSTGCLHGQHDYCQSDTGLAGAKKPSRCKWCDAFCQCPCHTTAGPAATEATEPVHCPCSGVHFPSPDNCRWCKCHRSRRSTAPAATEATEARHEAD